MNPGGAEVVNIHTRIDNPFDALADEYDAWFDREPGRTIFEQEVACLKKTADFGCGDWLEVGVGTGRFAAALGITNGIEPSPAMAKIAQSRGVATRVGVGESLTYDDESLDGVLLVVTICFVDRPLDVLAEAARVLRPGGLLVTGLVPSDTSWGEMYAKKATENHRFYRSATFYTVEDLFDMAGEVGLAPQGAASCLATPPDEEVDFMRPRDGVIPGFGFVATAFVK